MLHSTSVSHVSRLHAPTINFVQGRRTDQLPMSFRIPLFSFVSNEIVLISHVIRATGRYNGAINSVSPLVIPISSRIAKVATGARARACGRRRLRGYESDRGRCPKRGARFDTLEARAGAFSGRNVRAARQHAQSQFVPLKRKGPYYGHPSCVTVAVLIRRY